MSYCRWSTDDYQSDVYVYEDASGGWTTHVANRRFEWTSELPGPVRVVPGDEESLHAWLARHRLVSDMLDDPAHGRWAEVPDPQGGVRRSFNHDSPGECADNLERLAGLGILVPEGVVQTLREEQAELDAD